MDTDVYDKFTIAASLSEQDVSEALEISMKQYIADSFTRTSDHYRSALQEKNDHENDSYGEGKANRRIHLWAYKPEQYNHKIVKAFFEVERRMGQVSLDNLEKICSDKNRPEFYVPTFKSNYAQMKTDAPHSHGKVFEDDGEIVIIWDEVRDTLLRYKKFFVES